MTVGEMLAHPAALPSVLLAPAAAWFFWVRRRRGRARMDAATGSRIAARAAGADARPRRAPDLLFALALLAAVVAALGPLWGDRTETSAERGADVVVCVDVSRSMLSTDQPPSRLDAARQAVAEMARDLRGGRLALVAFAGEARLVSPLTRDVDSFLHLLDRLEPLTVGRGGTDLGAAIDVARSALGGDDARAIVLLTDGEDHEGGGLLAAQACRERGVPVHCVGFGSDRGGKVPGDDAASFLRDRSGGEVVSARDADGLRRIAGAAGGVFVDSVGADRPLARLHEQQILPAAGAAASEDGRREKENRYQWPLSAAFCLWILERCLRTSA